MNKAIRVLAGLFVALVVLLIGLYIWVTSGSNLNKLLTTFTKSRYERWVSQFEAYGVQPGDTVFLGDSLTEWGAWNELFPHSHVRNRGIAGDSTAGVLARMAQITEGKPAQIFLMIGTNDLFGGVPRQEIVANIVSIVEIIRRDSPRTDIFVQSVLPRQAGFKDNIESLNSALRAAVAGKATWVDLYPLFLDDAGESMDESLSNDKLHLMAAGYTRWRDAIAHRVSRANGARDH